ncbi:MAG: [protein-PII] uridylyltransferase [Desulfuromonadales bacterium]|nr:[protein-PII] uridylyltransferase [Desulfuromonadales bacterium]
MEYNIDKFFYDSSDGLEKKISSFEDERSKYLESSRRFLSYYRDKIKLLHDSGAEGEVVVKELAAMTDTLILKLYSIVADNYSQSQNIKQKIALVAVGGYGRGELNPFSDIDLMFLHTGKRVEFVEDIAKKILYFLWDMKMEVGYSVRTIKESIQMSKQDITILTSLLERRFLTGDVSLYKGFSKWFSSYILSKGTDGYIQQKLAEMDKRRKKFGSSVYILEPNIKESEGGLRDLQTAFWVAQRKFKVTEFRELVIKGVLTEEELKAFDEAKSWLWRIRNELHYISGKKNDQLTFDAQIQLADFCGFKNSGRLLAVEEFMRFYYLQATKNRHLASLLISRATKREDASKKILGFFIRRSLGEGLYVLKGELIIPDGNVISKNPVLLMKIFEAAQTQGVKLSSAVMELVRQNLYLMDEDFRKNSEVNASFMNILRSDKYVVETLKLMHYLEVLNHYIPEFEHIYCKVQHDVYHIYTVDIHSLFCVEEIVKLLKGEHAEDLPALTSLVSDIDKRELLLLAILLHDIGKGEGGDHAEKGAILASNVAGRMGLSQEDKSRLEFLVRNHLLFAHIAQRRDLHDEQMIIGFAKQMGSSETLKMLYLLTYADVRGIGPDVWNDWKKMLFQELYEKTFNVLERGDFSLEASSQRVTKVYEKVISILENDFEPESVLNELKALSTRHIWGNTPNTIAEHIEKLLKLEIEPVIVDVQHVEDKGYSVVTIATKDIPGLFCSIAGVMAANGINILGAQIHTSSNGKALDVLQVNSPKGFVITDDNRWKRIIEEMKYVLSGNLSVEALVEKRQQSRGLPEKSKPRFPSRIEIDNEISADYTVLDIYSHDKVGLLYSITRALGDLGLYIGIAKISTRIDQVADVFYVKDSSGNKILSETEQDNVRNYLLRAIDL